MSAASSRFDGLNLPQLLDLMHDRVLPEPVSWMPQTDGWWVVLAWLVGVLILCGLRYRAHRRRNRYRREALAALARIEPRAAEDPRGSAIAIAELVKRTALAVWPREEVASLHGEPWAEFLVASSSGDAQVAAAAPAMARAAYDPGAEGGVLLPAARRWIRVHRA